MPDAFMESSFGHAEFKWGLRRPNSHGGPTMVTSIERCEGSRAPTVDILQINWWAQRQFKCPNEYVGSD